MKRNTSRYCLSRGLGAEEDDMFLAQIWATMSRRNLSGRRVVNAIVYLICPGPKAAMVASEYEQLVRVTSAIAETPE